ncbi:MAG: hypothetical protein AAB091_04450, partial [Elusimicrobiota bacterium]
MTMFKSLLMLGFAIQPLHAASVFAPDFVNRVAVIDSDTDAVVARIPVGAQPQDTAITPNGRLAFVANGLSGNVSVIDTKTNSVLSIIVVVRPDFFGVRQVVAVSDTRVFAIGVCGFLVLDVGKAILDPENAVIDQKVDCRFSDTTIAELAPDRARIYVSKQFNGSPFFFIETLPPFTTGVIPVPVDIFNLSAPLAFSAVVSTDSKKVWINSQSVVKEVQAVGPNTGALLNFFIRPGFFDDFTVAAPLALRPDGGKLYATMVNALSGLINIAVVPLPFTSPQGLQGPFDQIKKLIPISTISRGRWGFTAGGTKLYGGMGSGFPGQLMVIDTNVDTITKTFTDVFTLGGIAVQQVVPPPDISSPTIVDLVATVDLNRIKLTWTAPSDDVFVSKYGIRFATFPVTNLTFTQAIPAVGVPRPKAPGTSQEFLIRGLPPGQKIHFAIRAFDSAGNFSISAPVSTPAPVAIPPEIILRFAGQNQSGGTGDGGLATDATLNFPNGVDVDNSGNVYIADQVNCVIRKVDAKGIITTVAGRIGSCSFFLDGGPATESDLNGPSYVAVDDAGNIFIFETNTNRLRKVDTAGRFSTLLVKSIVDITADKDGNVYIAAGFPGFPLERLAPDGTLTTLIPGSGRSISADVDREGNVFFVDQQANQIFRRSPAGVITVIGGTGVRGFSGDGGLASTATFNSPFATAVSGTDLYISDLGNRRVRKINLKTGIVTTVAGTGTFGSTGDDGLATLARIFPTRIIADLGSNIYLAYDGTRHVIRAVGAPGPAAPVVDITPPADITTLKVTAISSSTVSLSWVAVGDDGFLGQASSYTLKVATFSLDSNAFFNQATTVVGVSTPLASGTTQFFTVQGLNQDTTYFFAIKAIDKVGNIATGFVQASTKTIDVVPPDTIANLTIAKVNFSSFTLTWTAPGDNFFVGTIASYEIRFATFPVTPAAFNTATLATGPPAPLPPGTLQTFDLTGLAQDTTFFVAVKALDDDLGLFSIS